MALKDWKHSIFFFKLLKKFNVFVGNISMPNINTSQQNVMDSIKIDSVQITFLDLNMKSLRSRETRATIYELSPQRNIPGDWKQVEVLFICEVFVLFSAFVYRTK
jgi:hypothetical protein